MNEGPKKHNIATAGLPETAPYVDQVLRDKGIDPDRLSVLKLGPVSRVKIAPGWVWRLLFGFTLWALEIVLRTYSSGTSALSEGSL